ncbi:MAG: hypothetical protein WCI55_13020 [Armatimonadota bacterium]
MNRKLLIRWLIVLNLLVLGGWGVHYLLGLQSEKSETARLHEKVASSLDESEVMSHDDSIKIQAMARATFASHKISDDELDFCIALFHRGTKASKKMSKQIFAHECVAPLQGCTSWASGQEEKVAKFFRELSDANAPEENHEAALSMITIPQFPNRHSYLELLLNSKYEQVSSRAKSALQHEKK